MGLRNIIKSLAGMQDILPGVGMQEQLRNKTVVKVRRVDVPYTVETEAELTALDPQAFTIARIQTAIGSYVDFQYDPTATEGVPSTAAGFWVRRKAFSLQFDTVADMVAAKYLEVGDTVTTLGYVAKGDGGGNTYEVVAAATGTVDGGSFIDLVGSTGQAKGLFVDSIVKAKQFGAVLDGVADDAVVLQAASDYATQAVYVADTDVLVGSAVTGAFFSYGPITVAGVGSIAIKDLMV